MLALEPVIVERLRQALASEWTVKGLFSDTGKREPDMFASVMFADSDVPASEATGVLVRPLWTVTLMVRRGDPVGATAIDVAFAVVIEALHGWAPPAQGTARRWERLRLLRVKPPPYPENGLVGVELGFSTSARFDGQP